MVRYTQNLNIENSDIAAVEADIASKASQGDLTALQNKIVSLAINVDANACTVSSAVRYVQAGNIAFITGVIKAKKTSAAILSIPNKSAIGVQTGTLYQNLSLAKSCRYKLTNNSAGWAELTLYEMEVGIDYSLAVPFALS